MDLKVSGLVKGIERNRAFTIEALRFALLSVILTFEKIQNDAYSIELAEQQPQLNDGFQILSSCWTVIDAMVRAGELSKHIRGLKRTSEVRLFHAAASKAEYFRNYFQHLPTEIPGLPSNAQPTMGSLSWVSRDDARKSTTVWISTGGAEASVYGLTLDTKEHRFVGDFLFSAAANDLRLGDLAHAASAFSGYFDSWLRNSLMLAENSIGCSKLTWAFDLAANDESESTTQPD